MRSILTIAMLGIVFSHHAFAYDDDWGERGHAPHWKQRDYAIVRSVTPQYETVSQPRQECRSEWVTENIPRYDGNGTVGTIVGGVAGGVLGHQIGKGRGKDVATVAGTLIGAMVGNQLGERNSLGPVYDTSQREVQRCRQVNDYSQRVRDYRVEYEYRSQVYSANMNRYPGNPGARIPVKLLVELDEDWK